jgi:tRNA nucleotidyltransferase (CCA-adding enzyme)
MALDEAVLISRDMPVEMRKVVMYGTLVHDIGKPTTTVTEEDGHITSKGHDDVGVDLARIVLVDQMNLDLDTVEKIVKIVADHLAPKFMFKDKASDSAVRRLAKRIVPATIEELVAVARADSWGRGTEDAKARKSDSEDWLIEQAKNLKVEREGPKAILMGRHLVERGVKPGPDMGVTLKRVFELQLDGKITTLDEALVEAGFKG